MPDDSEFMAAADFARLTVSQQCDVWAAADAGLIRYREQAKGQPRLYDRADVQRLLGTGVQR